MTPLLLDMGLPRRTAGDLRDAGWDAVHVAEVGKASATDAELIALARAERRAVVTLDSDFARLLATSRATTPSLLHLRLDPQQKPLLLLLPLQKTRPYA